jgi:RNA polymerase sigma factor (TIGR02999 family)
VASPGEITELLLEWGKGDPSAADRLFPLVYQELRRIARNQLRQRAPNQTLGATELVHETYLRLVDQTKVATHDRGHFFALAAKAMRHILVDRARRRSASKRGGSEASVSLSEGDGAELPRALEILELDEALGRLEEIDPRLVQLVELRFFGGLTVEETAEALSTSPRTVKREWQKARAFLYRALEAP